MVHSTTCSFYSTLVQVKAKIPESRLGCVWQCSPYLLGLEVKFWSICLLTMGVVQGSHPFLCTMGRSPLS